MKSARIATLGRDIRRFEHLLRCLEDLYQVRFVASNEPDQRSYDAAVLFGVSRTEALQCARSGLRCLAFVRGQLRQPSSLSSEVSFAQTPYLSPCFRGAAIADPSVKTLCDVVAEPADEVIARIGKDVLWIHRPEGGSAADLLAVTPPTLVHSDYLFSRFQENDWFSILPLLHFVREISGWTYPPVRACFMFDDPNLHWKSYGYISYKAMLQDARKTNYHVSFATVPMDGWFVHRPTARLFTENDDRLSFLIHGNDHTHAELHQTSGRSKQTALAAKALRRIEHLEHVSGVRVSRVMAAPHGACSPEMATALLRTGFEAACISRSSMMVRNPGSVWPESVGLNPAAFLGGLPIIPRFNIRGNLQIRVRFAAFLGQPVIPSGHHDDLQLGPELVQRTAAVVNSIGEVRWRDLATIARSNYCTRPEGDLLHVRMYSRLVQLRVPSGVTQLRVDRPWLGSDSSEALAVQEGQSEVLSHESYRGQVLTVSPECDLTIRAPYPDAVALCDAPPSRTRLRAIVRRQLCEGRDRLRPTLDALSRLAGTSL